MSFHDQLEIIRANGQVEFYDLTTERGVTNIGRHPENDIVLNSPGIAPFHAVLDHRRKPYQLVILSHGSATRLGEQMLRPNVAGPMRHRDALRLDGHTLILLEQGLTPNGRGDQTATAAMPALNGQATQLATVAPPLSRPEAQPLPAIIMPTRRFATAPGDTTSESILLELPGERAQTVEVGQTASFPLTIINGGNIVATFTVEVVGLPAQWVTVSPPQVNLFEGERTTVTVYVTPPRQPGSRAGLHHFALAVASPNYPEQRSQRGAELTIKPFFDFAVSELTPKRQTLSWFKQTGLTEVSITNRGNSEVTFRVEGEDDERACRFEFSMPGETVVLARQVDVQAPPETAVSVPVSITPISRRLIGLRKRSYAFTMTTTLLEGQQTPRSLLGELKKAPLIGPFSLLLIGLLFIGLIFYLFWPSLTFNANPGTLVAGQQATLAWNAFPPFFATTKINNEPVEGPRGTATVVLNQTTTYEATTNTWLSTIFPFLAAREVRTVEVIPVRPSITLFKALPEEVLSGEPVVLSWFVVGADELTLIDNSQGKADTLTESTGSRQFILDQDASFTLRAINASGPDTPVEKLVNIKVSTPTPEAVEPPVIQSFMVEPKVISAGQQVTLQWAVSGADSVSVQPIGANLPPNSPPISHAPQQTTLYVLSATNGEQTVNAVQQVVVGEAPAPTPTPTPATAPVIELLAITPEEQVRVTTDEDDQEKNEIEVQVNWVVTGDATNVELTGGPPGFERLSGLSRIGQTKFTVQDTTVLVLTATNGDAQAVKTTQVKFLDPTPTPTAEATDEAATDGSGGSDGGSTSGDAPDIEAFVAQGVSSADQISLVNGVYRVVAGANIVLKWETAGADTVTLVGVGDQPPTGSYTLSKVVADQTFQLKASSEGGASEAFLEIVVVAKPAPPPPSGVSGETTGSNLALTWAYSAENEIIGFRVYRATAVSGPFNRVADESQLANSARQYVDAGPLPTCTAYYVTAVYLDPPSGNKMETPASANSWFSGGCP